MFDRRAFLAAAGGTTLLPWALIKGAALCGDEPGNAASDLTITSLQVTPIALPDPPILAASGCHGPYFLRNIVEIGTAEGITGFGETHGGTERTEALEKCREVVVGKSAFAYRAFASQVLEHGARAWAGIELACLDAVGRATGLSLSRLLGGPVRDEVEFSSYLFFRYAADDPRVLSDPRLVDERGRGERALDPWGEVRTPEGMAEMAAKWHDRWGFTHHKLKAGVLLPDIEVDALRAINHRFGGRHPLRIDPNGRWTIETAVRVGRAIRELPIEYYEDPVRGQDAMAEVRRRTGHKMSTNSCVTSFEDVADAVIKQSVDIVLCDHHYWGGISACQGLGTLAEAVGWSLSQHSNNHAGITMAAMIHVGALIPQLTHPSDTHYPWLPEGADVIDGPNLTIRDGRMAVPAAPGVGVELDRDKLARAHEVYEKCGMRGRDDAETMRRFEPGWERTDF